jgi:hypothetical protein
MHNIQSAFDAPKSVRYSLRKHARLLCLYTTQKMMPLVGCFASRIKSGDTCTMAECCGASAIGRFFVL